MAEQAIPLGLQAVPLVTQHYRKVWDPVQHRFKKMTGELSDSDPDIRDHRTHEEKGYTLRRRSQVAPDEEVVETVRHRGEVRPRRPGYKRRSSSMNDADSNYYRNRGGYESEGSVPPRSRTRQKSKNGGSQKRGSSSSSSSSSDVCSSSEDERNIKKMQRKKWITAALASVATIHAAQKVYSSIESHDKRILDVQAGKISPEEAHKKQRNMRWQDAAAIGIAALGIKGAISEWNEVQEEHAEHRELMEKKQQHHKKRLEKMRRDKAREQGGYYKGRDGQWYHDGHEMQDSERSQLNRSQLDGPRNGERKLLEDPGRQRTRSAYGSDDRDFRNDRRDRSRYGRSDINRDDDRYSRDDRRRSSRYSRNDDH